MARQDSLWNKVDWLLVSVFFALVILGWLNIYAVVYDEQEAQNIFSTSLNSGRQLIFIAGSVLIIIAIMIIDFKFFDSFAYILYGATILALIAVLTPLGTEIAGNHSWFTIGSFRLQPSRMLHWSCATRSSEHGHYTQRK